MSYGRPMTTVSLLGSCLTYPILIKKSFSIKHTVKTMFMASFRLNLENEHMC